MVDKKTRKLGKKKVKFSLKVPSGWNTTDEDEIIRRRLRAETEAMKVVNLTPENSLYFSTYAIHSASSQIYTVEIRSLREKINSCGCPDAMTNRLGTCKHIEKVLLTLQKKAKRAFKAATEQGSETIEMYVDPRDHVFKILKPQGHTPHEIHTHLLDLFSSDGTLLSDPEIALPVIKRLIENHPACPVRLSVHSHKMLVQDLDFTKKIEAKQSFLQDVADGKRTLDITKLPLYDYQKQGMLHLAFLKKAILADDMGLGKTVQAIAACELLRRTQGIQRVLVVAPTSLKAEWEEQIAKFVDLRLLVIYGSRGERLHQYQQDAFFYIMNYEQVVRDQEEIQRILSPDVIILDEAQRIKNWRTKTASTIKKLESNYAFVLTGTPLENRIDDIYSLVEFLNPTLFGSLFRFNRDFYEFDEKGAPKSYKNLHLLHQRLKPILLRRLKQDVEGQLPARTVNTYFVQMSAEQHSRYREQEEIVARISMAARKRPLREEEFKRLQAALSCMRMLCDTPYILDETCRICPKIEELQPLLEELLQEATTKILIFSEWERMLILVKEVLIEKNIGTAWHTGSIDQQKRRGEINRFKEDPNCRVLLSTDCGAVGLNLQAANVVINLDLPWNPAKLEQRIARAWRKHQTRSVQVINLVSEHTLEHRMMGVLNLKQRLAESVLDLGTVDEMAMPSGRKSFMDQLSKLMGDEKWNTPPETQKAKQHSTPQKDAQQEDPLTQIHQEVMARFKPRLHHLKSHTDATGQQTLFAVMEGDLTHPRAQMEKLLETPDGHPPVRLELLDQATYETIQRLCEAGILSFQIPMPPSSSASRAPSRSEEHAKRLKAAQKHRDVFERKDRMATLLIDGGFLEEALSPLKEVFEEVLYGIAALKGQTPIKDETKGLVLESIQDLVTHQGIPKEALDVAHHLRAETSLEPDDIQPLAQKIHLLTHYLETEISHFSLECAA